jgi:hypothetical protein
MAAAPYGKFRERLTAARVTFFPYDVPTMFLPEARKTRKRRKKCTSKILVYCFILARVNYKSKPWIESHGFRNRRAAAARRDFHKKNQGDKGAGAPLNAKARGFRLYYT